MADDILDVLDAKDKEEEKKATRAKKGTKTAKKKKPTKKEIRLAEISDATIMPDNYFTVWTKEELTDMVDFFNKQEIIAVDTETTGTDVFKDTIVGFSLYAGDKGYYVPLDHKDNVDTPPTEGRVGVDYVKVLDIDLVTNIVKPLFEDSTKKFILHNCKFDQHVLFNNMGIRLKPYADTMVMSRLLDENTRASLKELAGIYLGIKADKFNQLFPKIIFNTVPILINPTTGAGNLASYYAIKDTDMTLKLFEFFSNAMENPRLSDIKKLMYDLEMPLSEVAFEAEQHGVRFDNDYMQNTVKPEISAKITTLRERLTEVAGEINLNSTKQVAELLYDKLKLPVIDPKKPRCTDQKTLNKLKVYHPVISDMLEYRKLIKLQDAFTETLPTKQVGDRIHPTFNTVRAKTGRMSCIAEGTLITLVNSRKPIEDVKVGDLVYCYDEEGNPRISKVLTTMYNGYRDCIKVNWKSKDTDRGGSLICTPEHRIRLMEFKEDEDKWIRADMLEEGHVTTQIIASVERDYVQHHVYDLEIEDHHNFIASEICVHNCSEPNTQNIPAGNLVRNAFIADEGRMLVSIDYSGQEIRMLAHFSQDPLLLDIFKTGKDLHSMLGCKIWNDKHPDEQVSYETFSYYRDMSPLFQDADGNVIKGRAEDGEYVNKLLKEGKIETDDPEELIRTAKLGKVFDKTRKFAKATTFGVIYGISKYGLADQLDISTDEAQELIDNFYDMYKGVNKWVKAVHKLIKKNKYTKTLLGRKRRLYPYFTNGHWWEESRAARQGVNAIIQGKK